MPFLAYVHARDPGRQPGDRPAWEPNWLVWRWVAAAVIVGYAASRSQGAVELVLVFVVFGLVLRALVEALPGGDGLREYRQ